MSNDKSQVAIHFPALTSTGRFLGRATLRILLFLAICGAIGMPDEESAKLYILTQGALLVITYVITLMKANRDRKEGVLEFSSVAKVRAVALATSVVAITNLVAEVIDMHSLPGGAFTAVYCLILLVLSPIPYAPGEETYRLLTKPQRLISILALAILIAFYRRFGLTLSLLFMVAESVRDAGQSYKEPCTVVGEKTRGWAFCTFVLCGIAVVLSRL